MKKIIAVLAIALAGALVPITSASASTGSNGSWISWDRSAYAAVENVNTTYNALQKALGGNNLAIVEGDLVKLSVESVTLASVANSPGPKTNADLVRAASDLNKMAWAGYIYVTTQSGQALSLYKADRTAMNNDFLAATADMKAHR